jgi:hypothetical protein
MNPRGILAWLPVIREVADLIRMAVEAGRKRRARRRAERAAVKRMGLDK